MYVCMYITCLNVYVHMHTYVHTYARLEAAEAANAGALAKTWTSLTGASAHTRMYVEFYRMYVNLTYTVMLTGRPKEESPPEFTYARL